MVKSLWRFSHAGSHIYVAATYGLSKCFLIKRHSVDKVNITNFVDILHTSQSEFSSGKCSQGQLPTDNCLSSPEPVTKATHNSYYICIHDEYIHNIHHISNTVCILFYQFGDIQLHSDTDSVYGEHYLAIFVPSLFPCSPSYHVSLVQ